MNKIDTITLSYTFFSKFYELARLSAVPTQHQPL